MLPTNSRWAALSGESNNGSARRPSGGGKGHGKGGGGNGVCEHFKRGICRHGDRCRLQHVSDSSSSSGPPAGGGRQRNPQHHQHQGARPPAEHAKSSMREAQAARNEAVLQQLPVGHGVLVRLTVAPTGGVTLTELVPSPPPQTEDGAAAAVVSVKKPLLVLDLNGVLVDRKPYGQRGGGGRIGGGQRSGGNGGKEVFARRPHLDSFLDFCFQHFEVGNDCMCLSQKLGCPPRGIFK